MYFGGQRENARLKMPLDAQLLLERKQQRNDLRCLNCLYSGFVISGSPAMLGHPKMQKDRNGSECKGAKLKGVFH